LQLKEINLINLSAKLISGDLLKFFKKTKKLEKKFDPACLMGQTSNKICQTGLEVATNFEKQRYGQMLFRNIFSMLKLVKIC
jgi:hypothetical protein